MWSNVSHEYMRYPHTGTHCNSDVMQVFVRTVASDVGWDPLTEDTKTKLKMYFATH